MKLIRIGNDIQINWVITRFGEPEDFSDKTLSVALYDKYNNKQKFEYTIEGNKISGCFYGKDQITNGVYRLFLVENEGEENMVSLDFIDCFCLSYKLKNQTSNGEDPSNINTEVVEVTSDINTKMDLSDYATIEYVDEKDSDIYTDYNAKFTTVHSQIESLGGNLATLTNDVSNLNTNINSLESEVYYLTNDVSILNTNINSLESEVSYLTNDVSILNTNINSLESEVYYLANDVSNLNTNINSLESEVYYLANDVSNLNTNINSLESEVYYLTNDVSNLNTNINSLESEVSYLEVCNTNLNSRLNAVEINLPSYTSQLINDSGFITGNNISSIVVLTQSQFDQLSHYDINTEYCII